MNKLIENLKQIFEETDIKNIDVTWQEGTEPDNIKAIEFNLIYNDGDTAKYRSEASPYLHQTFLFYIKKGWYGKAISLVKAYTKRIDG